MRAWNLKPEDPLSLTLAADARLVATDYCNDHIWELVLTGGDPPSIALQTTYGLRAKSFRLFPRFIEAGLNINNPSDFFHPATIHLLCPNFARLSYVPFSEIEVEAEYWIPDSHSATGRLKLVNKGVNPRVLRIEWAAVLNPSGEGKRMSPLEMDNVPVLTGQTGDLVPVVFLTGGAEPQTSPYPALCLDLDLPLNTTRILTWAVASLGDIQASFNAARQITGRNFDVETTRIELLNSGQIDIYTGDPEWDIAFALSQKNVYTLFCGPTMALPAPSYVISRQPDFGYSPRGDGSDYNHLWNGQTPLEAWFLIGMLLPADPQLVKGILDNFLSAPNPGGGLDWKPGLGWQRSQLLATPLLACITWEIFEATQDISILEKAYPLILGNLLAWFSPQHDRDGDGIPEWDNVLQTGFEDHPLFAHWHRWSLGLDITTVESPELCSFLYRECEAISNISKQLHRTEPSIALQAHRDNLMAAIEASWDEKNSFYRYWDRDTHHSPAGEILGERYGPGEITIRRDFDQPIRLQVKVHTMGEASRRVEIFIHGIGPSGQHIIERLPNEKFRWYLGLGSGTSQRVYTDLEHIAIQGVDDKDRITLHITGYDIPDLTSLIPLWAGIPSPERARIMVKQTILDDRLFWQTYGLSACTLPQIPEEVSSCQNVYIPWNTMIGEGLVNYGYRAEAAELVTHLMNAVILNLKKGKGFRRFYDSTTGSGSGERDALDGFAPLSLFLQVLGVRIYTPKKVGISGVNPFPWPVTVKYRGLTVLRQSEKTTVIFQDGQTVTVEGEEPRIIALE